MAGWITAFLNLLGMGAGGSAGGGGSSIPVFVAHYRNQGLM